MNLRQGTLLQRGKYKIESVLGQGGFGITYRGVQTGLDRKVAVKEFFMKEYCERDESTSYVTLGSQGSRELVDHFRQKFLKEAQIIANLKNPHIISIYDIFEENGTAYYVMEYLSGGSLKDLVTHEGALSEADALIYIRQLADALAFIHNQKILHLDVKPSNVLLENHQTAVLIDFGISKRYDEEGSQTSSSPVGISKGFAPLEQYKRGGVNNFAPCTDIYSLGATLYFLLTGSNPPEANDVNDDGLPPLPTTVSFSTKKVVEQAMQPKRKDRLQSVSEFNNLLKSKKDVKVEDEDTIVSNKQVNQSELRIRNIKKWMLGIVILFIFAIIGYQLLRGNGKNTSELMDAEVDSTIVIVKDSIASVVAQVDSRAVNTNEQSDSLSGNVNELHRGKDSSVFLNDYSQLRIGDFYYNDGTFSHERNDVKMCVGIVFTLQTTVEERKHGWKHGQIVALTDACNKPCLWGPNNTFSEKYDIDNIEQWNNHTRLDRNGYTRTYGGKTVGNRYKAFQIARNYPKPLPDNTSGWYLPSIGQWIDILENIGKVSIYQDKRENYGHFMVFNTRKAVKNLKLLEIKNTASYYTSSEGTIFGPIFISFTEYFRPIGETDGNDANQISNIVRTVAAF